MGQYWIPVNLDKKEFVDPHKLGTGLKLWEQLANHPGTGTALIVLCAAMPTPRGGGDFDLPEVEVPLTKRQARKVGEVIDKLGVGEELYSVVAKRTIGRWSGDRIAIVGDYADDADLPKKVQGVSDLQPVRRSGGRKKRSRKLPRLGPGESVPRHH